VAFIESSGNFLLASMPTKRKEPMSSPQRKKAKKDPLAEKLQQQLREITAALGCTEPSAPDERR